MLSIWYAEFINAFHSLPPPLSLSLHSLSLFPLIFSSFTLVSLLRPLLWPNLPLPASLWSIRWDKQYVGGPKWARSKLLAVLGPVPAKCHFWQTASGHSSLPSGDVAIFSTGRRGKFVDFPSETLTISHLRSFASILREIRTQNA